MLLGAESRSTMMIWVRALLIGGALVAALFFNGLHVQSYDLALFLLGLWLLVSAWQGYRLGFHVPHTALTLCVTLFWTWLALSLLWNPAPQVGINYFWLVGCLPLAFWIYLLSADQERLWASVFNLVLLIGVALALWGFYQFFVQHQRPRSVFLDINSHASFLNLIALPAAGYFLLHESKWRAKKIALAAILFALIFAIALTQGRAAALSFALGMALLLAVVWGRVAKKDLGILFALIVGAFALANVAWSGGVVGRMETLFNPASAGQSRFIIWQQAWEMYKDAPWLGVGLGAFWLAWPPYRHPEDNSGGYYVHNDYLQIAVETGLPGLLLLLAVLGAAAWLFLQALRRGNLDTRARIELGGLGAGLLAVAVQSFFNFNLYIMPTLILAGVTLARFQQVAVQHLPVTILCLDPARWLRKRLYFTASSLLIAFLLLYFFMQGLADHYYQKALAQANQGEFLVTDDLLQRATRLTPLADNVLNTRADLMRHLLAGLTLSSAATAEQKKILYDTALALLDQAQELNPLRPDNLLTRGKLYQENSALAGADWARLAAAAYQKALDIDPRFYAARYAYARLLIAQGDMDRAWVLLEEGMKHWYFAQPKILPYYVLTANMRFYKNDTARADELRREIDNITKTQGVDKETLELINQSRIVPAAVSVK